MSRSRDSDFCRLSNSVPVPNFLSPSVMITECLCHFGIIESAKNVLRLFTQQLIKYSCKKYIRQQFFEKKFFSSMSAKQPAGIMEIRQFRHL